MRPEELYLNDIVESREIAVHEYFAVNWRVVWVVAMCIAAALLTLSDFSGTFASGFYPGGMTGFDISFPQCGCDYPDAPFDFGIVGVTRGRAFSRNPCLASEFAWATGHPLAPSLYMNLQYPIGATAPKGMTGPKGKCAKADKVCQAYNYGWNAAQDAFTYATGQGAASDHWWLDIEIANSWCAKPALNAQVIQAAIDFLHSQGITVGIYSTKRMWNIIAGSFAPALDIWVPGASSFATAPDFCTPAYAFGGGSVSLVQYQSGGFDAPEACP